MRAPITDKHLLEMMWERFPEIMGRGVGQPAQRTWVGLTDEEAQKVFHSEHCNISADLAGILARAMEAKLKAKNSP